MKRLFLFLFLASPVLAQIAPPPTALDNWPIANTVLTLTDPGATNQVVGWDNTAKKFIWVAGGAGGGGNVSNSGTPTAGQLAQWTSATLIKGVTLSGSGATMSIDTSGVLTISAIPNTTLTNSAITIAGTSTALGGTISRDTITGVASNGIVQRTAANTYGVATAKTDYWDTSDFTHSGTGHAHGLVPDPGATLGTTKFLREDATWVAPPGGGSGTVTNAANLANNAVVLGDAGTVGVKTSTGFTTDGASILTLGVGSTAGGLAIRNTNNSAITIVRGGSAAPSYTLTLPEGNNDNLVGRQSTDTLLNKTLEGALIGDSTSPGFTMRNAGNALTTVNPSANVSAVTLTLPITTTTLVGKDTTDTLTGKTLEGAILGDSISQGFLMKNATSQTTTVLPTSSGTPTITLPSSTTTLLGSTATGVQTFLTTPSSANLLAAMTDETGSGSLVFATSPTFVTPVLGTPTSGTLTNCTGLPAAGLLTNSRLRTVSFTVDGGGSVISTAKVKGFFTCPYSGTITAWNIVSDTTGTLTFKVWKKATGTAKPTTSDSINTSGISLASGGNTAIHSTTLSDFTSTTVTANDIFAAEITANSGNSTECTLTLEITTN